jgi:hypothetical protein
MSPIKHLFAMIDQFNATRDDVAAVILFKDLPYRPTHRLDVISRQSISSGAIDRVPESTHPGILIPTSTELYNPATWLKTGYSPTEIILAMAIFVGVVLSKRR